MGYDQKKRQASFFLHLLVFVQREKSPAGVASGEKVVSTRPGRAFDVNTAELRSMVKI